MQLLLMLVVLLCLNSLPGNDAKMFSVPNAWNYTRKTKDINCQPKVSLLFEGYCARSMQATCSLPSTSYLLNVCSTGSNPITLTECITNAILLTITATVIMTIDSLKKQEAINNTTTNPTSTIVTAICNYHSQQSNCTDKA